MDSDQLAINIGKKNIKFNLKLIGQWSMSFNIDRDA